MEYNELLRNNFSQIAQWVIDTFPHAIERSYTKKIKCDSLHHVHYTSYIVLTNGDVEYHRGSHGWEDYDRVFSFKHQQWYDCGKPKPMDDKFLEDFQLEWSAQKTYIIGTLQPYEELHTFKI